MCKYRKTHHSRVLCVEGKREERGAGTRLSAPPPQSHGAPLFQWKQVGSPDSSNHTLPPCGRGRVQGRRQDPTNFHTHHGKSRETHLAPHVAVPGGLRVFLKLLKLLPWFFFPSPERRWSSCRHLAAVEGGVGALQCRDASLWWRTCTKPDLGLFLLGLLCLFNWPVSFPVDILLWQCGVVVTHWKCLEKPNTTSLMMGMIWGSRCTTRKRSSMGSTSRQR